MKKTKYFLCRINFLIFWASLCSSQIWADISKGETNQALIQKDTLWATFESGGWIMWPILLCGMAAFAYGLERFINLRTSVVLPPDYKDKYDLVMKQTTEGKKNKTVLLPLLIDSTKRSEGITLFSRFLKRDYGSVRDMEQILQEYVELTRWRFQKNIKPLGLVAQISPLLGLLGTVVGMVAAFDVVAEQGMGKPEVLAEGMGVALLTTCFGLGIAIPASFFHHQFMERSAKISVYLYNLLHELGLALHDQESSNK